MALRKVGALWLKDSANGKFMTGTIEEALPASARLMVFKNSYKENDKHPDYTINLATDDDQRQATPQRQTRKPSPPSDSEVPF